MFGRETYNRSELDQAKVAVGNALVSYDGILAVIPGGAKDKERTGDHAAQGPSSALLPGYFRAWDR